MSLRCSSDGESERVHPLLQEVDGYALSEHISVDMLELLIDFDQSKRIKAVERSIRRRLDPSRDEELVHWFRLLKRVYALEIIVNSSIGVKQAEETLAQSIHEFDLVEIEKRYRDHLTRLYTDLPDAVEQKNPNIIPVFALPMTKTWILGEIANGWNLSVYSAEDQLNCLLFWI